MLQRLLSRSGPLSIAHAEQLCSNPPVETPGDVVGLNPRPRAHRRQGRALGSEGTERAMQRLEVSPRLAPRRGLLRSQSSCKLRQKPAKSIALVNGPENALTHSITLNSSYSESKPLPLWRVALPSIRVEAKDPSLHVWTGLTLVPGSSSQQDPRRQRPRLLHSANTEVRGIIFEGKIHRFSASVPRSQDWRSGVRAAFTHSRTGSRAGPPYILRFFLERCCRLHGSSCVRRLLFLQESSLRHESSTCEAVCMNLWKLRSHDSPVPTVLERSRTNLVSATTF